MIGWILGLATLAVGLVYLYFVFNKRYKEGNILEFIVWVLIITNTILSIPKFDLTNSSMYFSLGLILAFIARLFVFLKKGK